MNCLHCGRETPPPRGQGRYPKAYCSHRCIKAAARRRAGIPARVARGPRLCRGGCGRPPAPHRPYCSNACCPSAKKKGLLASTRTLTCARDGCAEAFTTRKPNRRYCSKACLARARPGDSPNRGRGRRFPPVRYAPRRAIFERDGWTCKVCGAPIDPTRRFPDPGFASIDHRDPDGAHEPANWQAAHLACNVSKGTKVRPGADPKLRRVAA